MAEDQPTLLKLLIEKGPRSGETLEFLPTHSPIRIGRVVRGSSVPIKDPGISTKHLTIEFKSNQWLITDNDSSNGTFLNSARLPPLSPAALGDGDTVKIGEVTLIRVGIVGSYGRGGDRVRRNPRRKGKLDAICKDEELGFGGDLGEEGMIEKEEKKPRGIPRREKAAEEGLGGNAGEDTELGFGGDLGKRARGRPKKEKVEIVSENVGTRRTRSSKNEIDKSSVDEEIRNEKVGVAVEVFEKKTRGGWGRRGKERALEDAGFGKKIEELGPVKVEPGPQQVSTRRTRSLKVIENGEKEDVDAHIGGVEITKKGKKRNNNDNEKLDSGEEECSRHGNLINVQSGDRSGSEKVVVKSEPREIFCEVEKFGDLQNLGTGKEEGERGGGCNGSDLGQAERVEGSGFKGREALDLEKMTLGEWFDYLDVYLPNSICEKTEQIISEMYLKAEKFREFVLEHEKNKKNGMLPVG